VLGHRSLALIIILALVAGAVIPLLPGAVILPPSKIHYSLLLKNYGELAGVAADTGNLVVYKFNFYEPLRPGWTNVTIKTTGIGQANTTYVISLPDRVVVKHGDTAVLRFYRARPYIVMRIKIIIAPPRTIPENPSEARVTIIAWTK